MAPAAAKGLLCLGCMALRAFGLTAPDQQGRLKLSGPDYSAPVALQKAVGDFAVTSGTVAARLPDNMPQPVGETALPHYPEKAAWGEDMYKGLAVQAFAKGGKAFGGVLSAGLDGMNHSHTLFQGEYSGMSEAASANLPTKGKFYAATDMKPKHAELVGAVLSRGGGLDYGKFSHHELSGHLTNDEIYRMLQALTAKDPAHLSAPVPEPATKPAAPAAAAPVAHAATAGPPPRPSEATVSQTMDIKEMDRMLREKFERFLRSGPSAAGHA